MLILTKIRYAMLSDIGRKHQKDRRQVLCTITQAKVRAERDNRPLLDIHNVQETPKK
jgi:hypothetical protein